MNSAEAGIKETLLNDTIEFLRLVEETQPRGTLKAYAISLLVRWERKMERRDAIDSEHG